MRYKVKIEKQVFKYISKLGNKEESYLKKRFDALTNNKKGYRILDVYKNVELWELRCSSHRVYYTVENGFIVIENIEYDGNIVVEKASHKNTQQKYINDIKKKMRK
jgi:mRNA-degrading endonuclease RelE of RelBE toxin-antitoxin system